MDMDKLVNCCHFKIWNTSGNSYFIHLKDVPLNSEFDKQQHSSNLPFSAASAVGFCY